MSEKSFPVLAKKNIRKAKELLKEARLSSENFNKKKKLCSYVLNDYESLINEEWNETDNLIFYKELKKAVLKHDWPSVTECLKILLLELSGYKNKQIYKGIQKEKMFIFYHALYILVLSQSSGNSSVHKEFLFSQLSGLHNTSTTKFLDT